MNGHFLQSPKTDRTTARVTSLRNKWTSPPKSDHRTATISSLKIQVRKATIQLPPLAVWETENKWWWIDVRKPTVELPRFAVWGPNGRYLRKLKVDLQRLAVWATDRSPATHSSLRNREKMMMKKCPKTDGRTGKVCSLRTKWTLPPKTDGRTAEVSSLSYRPYNCHR